MGLGLGLTCLQDVGIDRDELAYLHAAAARGVQDGGGDNAERQQRSQLDVERLRRVEQRERRLRVRVRVRVTVRVRIRIRIRIRV